MIIAPHQEQFSSCKHYGPYYFCSGILIICLLVSKRLRIFKHLYNQILLHVFVVLVIAPKFCTGVSYSLCSSRLGVIFHFSRNFRSYSLPVMVRIRPILFTDRYFFNLYPSVCLMFLSTGCSSSSVCRFTSLPIVQVYLLKSLRAPDFSYHIISFLSNFINS